MKKTTILIAEDHALVSEMWSVLLNADPRFAVVGTVRSGEEAVLMAKKLNPDIIMMDINLSGISGIEATKKICKQSPKARILGVSLYTMPLYAREMMQNGARGYITKNSPGAELITALVAIEKGNTYICNEIKNILSEQMMTGDSNMEGLHSISPRELEVISFIRKGASSKGIAEELEISVTTVEVHRRNILKKLNLKNAASLVNFVNNTQLKFTR